jgi:hypothetical protein
MCSARPHRATPLWLLVLLGACFQSTAPEGWLPIPEVAQREAYGAWIRVEHRQGAETQVVEGELIAAMADSLHVLAADSLVTLPMTAVASATLTTYDARSEELSTWTALLAVSTLSHGIGLVLTMPLWIIIGTAETAGASKDPRVESVDAALLRPYARFPQGLPPGIDRNALRAKPVRS